MSRKMVLVIGGAASGKSAFAENLINDSGLRKNYIATSRVWDDEIKLKVERHKTARGDGWTTLESPLAPEAALADLASTDAVLLDCATMWLTNHLMDETDLAAATSRLLGALGACPSFRVVVTNDVGGGIVPADALSRRFRQEQGELNQGLAAQADVVVHVIAGLPNVLKGSL